MYKQIDERHYKRIDHPFYGNQHVAVSRRKRLQNHKPTKPFVRLRAFLALVIFLSIIIYKGVTSVEAYFNPPIISPIPEAEIVHKNAEIVPTGTTVPLPTKTPVKHQITGSTMRQITIPQDDRVVKLQAYLVKRNSPLQYYAKEIVQLADYYAIDYTLVPSIAGKESSFGTAIKPNSFNAWGVMAWDNTGKRFIRSFSSWDEGIKFETMLLAKNYKINANEAIGAKYCPKTECSATWAEDVTNFSQAINQN